MGGWEAEASRRVEPMQQAQSRSVGAQAPGERRKRAARGRERGRARGREGEWTKPRRWQAAVEEVPESCARSSAARSGRKHRRKGRPRESEARRARVKRGGSRPGVKMSVEEECGLLLVQVVRMAVVV